MRGLILVLFVLGVSVAACSGQAPGTASPPPATVAPAPTSAALTIVPTTAPTKALASTPALPAPAELQGSWRAVIASKVAILEFTETGYTISWLGGGHGGIEVDGEEITFLGSPQCPGRGTYRWSIDSDKLDLEPVGTDPCPFRFEWARSETYTRYD
jgi:hypothetical protein